MASVCFFLSLIYQCVGLPSVNLMQKYRENTKLKTQASKRLVESLAVLNFVGTFLSVIEMCLRLANNSDCMTLMPSILFHKYQHN